MKTVEDYMQDDDIKKMPEYLQNIHAIRRVIMEETEGMTVNEITAYHKKEIDEYFSNLGLPPPQYADLSGQGRIDYVAAQMS
jgi:hypothetical protein